MSIKYLIDTNVLSEPLRPKPRGTVLRKLQKHEQEIAIASIVYGTSSVPEWSVYHRPADAR